MILDRLENSATYYPMGDGLKKALEFLRSADIDALADGRHAIDGDRMYALVQRYETEPADRCKLEAHRRYLDVQYIAKGREAMGYLPLTGRETCAYDEAKDFVSVSCADGASCEDGARIPMTQGMFMVLYPQDGHRPKCMIDRPEPVVKIVVKVAVEA